MRLSPPNRWRSLPPSAELRLPTGRMVARIPINGGLGDTACPHQEGKTL